MLSPLTSDRASRTLATDPGSLTRWRHLAIAMLFAGALLVETGLAVGWIAARGPVGRVHGVAVAFAVLAGLTGWVRLASHRRFAGTVIVVCTAAITVLTAELSGTTMVPVFYVWPLLAASYLLTRRGLGLVTALTAAACGAGLAQYPGAFPMADFLILMACGAVVILTVRVLSENLNRSLHALRQQSLTDPLTGLLNRRGFDRLLGRQFERAIFEGRPIVSVLLDIDHFKAINDTFGHPVGDAAIKHFADLLRDSCRAGDIIGRLGGEEFAVVMPGATTSQALARATDFADRLRASSFRPGLHMTASIGIAAGTNQPTFADMLTAADAAVYEAKRSGRDRTIVAPSTAREHRDAA